MKFVSKLPNFRLVLRPGLPGNRQLGTPSISGIYVRFENGIAKINNQEMIEMMLNHPGCGKDGDNSASFFPIKENESDPFEGKRPEIEPLHTMSNIEHGSVVKTINARKPNVFSTEQMEIVKKMVEERAKEMLAGVLKEANKPIGENVNKSEKRFNPDEDFGKLAPEPQELPEGMTDFGNDESELAVPVVERVAGKVGGAEIGDLKIDINPVSEVIAAPRRGRPPVKKQ